MFGRRKVYGESKANKCPFCEKTAISKNAQKIPVCEHHKASLLPDCKCLCGEWLDIREGKWGPFFTCERCGAISFAKGLEMNPDALKKNTTQQESKPKNSTPLMNRKFPPQPKSPENAYVKKETIIRSDDPDYFY